jgi:transposase
MDELREAVRGLNTKLNDRVMRKFGLSRRALFEQIERAALKPLPEHRFEHTTWAQAKVGPDYHVEYEKHYYSVPHTLLGKRVDVRVTTATIEVLHRGLRVASHRRSMRAHAYTTLPEHMPSSHREHAKWTPERITSWAKTLGPNVASLASEIMRRRSHPEQGYRSCLGLIRLANHYGAERLDAACGHAIKICATSRKSVESILKNGLDKASTPDSEKPPLAAHENVRGPTYYH